MRASKVPKRMALLFHSFFFFISGVSEDRQKYSYHSRNLNNEKMFKPLLHERNKMKPNVSRHHRGKRVFLEAKRKKRKR
jgi:hypothetical protein